jgi:hypothetical protein
VEKAVSQLKAKGVQQMRATSSGRCFVVCRRSICWCPWSQPTWTNSPTAAPGRLGRKRNERFGRADFARARLGRAPAGSYPRSGSRAAADRRRLPHVGHWASRHPTDRALHFSSSDRPAPEKPKRSRAPPTTCSARGISFHSTCRSIRTAPP